MFIFYLSIYIKVSFFSLKSNCSVIPCRVQLCIASGTRGHKMNVKI
jgi:hypothetical protein